MAPNVGTDTYAGYTVAAGGTEPFHKAAGRLDTALKAIPAKWRDADPEWRAEQTEKRRKAAAKQARTRRPRTRRRANLKES